MKKNPKVKVGDIVVVDEWAYGTAPNPIPAGTIHKIYPSVEGSLIAFEFEENSTRFNMIHAIRYRKMPKYAKGSLALKRQQPTTSIGDRTYKGCRNGVWA